MFTYEKENLILKQGNYKIPVQDIAENYNIPFYLYDIQGLKEWYRFFLQATDNRLEVFFSMKANFNKQILKALQEEGCGVDVVSGGEARLAQKVGFQSQNIIFSGVGKSLSELEEAVTQNFFPNQCRKSGRVKKAG